jgi:hypothetical protein
MLFRSLCLASLCLICILGVKSAGAQYILPHDTLNQAKEDSTAKGDSTAHPAAKKPAEQTEDPVAEAPPRMTDKQLLDMAGRWIQRMLYRGALDTKVIGAHATYQLTAWSEAGGSYGPVEARITVSYLGTISHQGKEAEWLQAIYQTMNDEQAVVEFDLTVAAAPDIKEIQRVFYRVDGGSVLPVSFSELYGAQNADSVDHAVDEGPDQVRLYAGTFEADKFRGVGDNGSDVVIYRAANVPPLGIVRMGYGDQGLTYISGGNNAAARFLPPGTR